MIYEFPNIETTLDTLKTSDAGQIKVSYTVNLPNLPKTVVHLNYKELLQKNCRPEHSYSIVISDLEGLVKPDYIQIRLFQYDEVGRIRETQSGAAFGRCATLEDFNIQPNVIPQHATYTFSTP